MANIEELAKKQALEIKSGDETTPPKKGYNVVDPEEGMIEESSDTQPDGNSKLKSDFSKAGKKSNPDAKSSKAVVKGMKLKSMETKSKSSVTLPKNKDVKMKTEEKSAPVDSKKEEGSRDSTCNRQSCLEKECHQVKHDEKVDKKESKQRVDLTKTAEVSNGYSGFNIAKKPVRRPPPKEEKKGCCAIL